MSDAADLAAAVRRAIAGRELLSHPFYQRWSRGELSGRELARYAGQYRHLEAALPGWLETIRDGSDDDAVRGAVQRNLTDEAGGSPTHLELFDGFAAAVGAAPAAPAPATAHLLETCTVLARTSAADGLAGLLAYEVQSSEVSASKAAGLREHFDLDGAGVDFWDVHSGVDADHAAWALEALVAAGADPERVEAAAGEAARAWWAFLDEREDDRLA